VSTEASKEASRIMYLEQLKARIERGEYEVDPDAVASSVVERLEALQERLAYRQVNERQYVSAEVVEPQ
jgi:Anti-sigma-28 factor, FlgM